MMMSMLFPFWFVLLGGLGGAPVSDSPETVRAHYEEAASYLDAGGDFYAVKNVEGQAWQSLDKLGVVLNAMPMQQGGEQTELISRIKDFLTDHGALTTHTVASSTVPRKDGLRDVKLFIGRDPAARDGNFWRGLVGSEPRLPKHLSSLTAQTAMALETAMEIDRLWAIIRDGILRFACNGDESRLQQMLADAQQETGVNLDALFNGLGHDFTLSLQLDSTETVNLPGMNGGMEIPKPDFLIMVGVSNDAPLRFLRHLFAEEGNALTPTETEFGTLYQLAQPLDGPIKMQFAAMVHRELLYFASSPRVIRTQLGSPGSSRLESQATFKGLHENVYEKGNVFFYCDATFRAALNQILEEIKSNQGQSHEMAVMMSLFLPRNLPEVSSGWSLVNHPEGLLLSGTGKGDFARQAIGGSTTGAYLPMMAGIAIPSFVRARSHAQRNACINNLRMLDAAKQQWAIETGTAADAVPGPQDLSPYLQGDFEDVNCPKGGNYSINKVDRKPTCSIPGHRI